MPDIKMHLVGAVALGILVSVAFHTRKPARINPEGWRVLRPGWLLNGAIIASAGLAMFIGYVCLFVGSSRPDADSQMAVARLLAFGCGLATLYLFWLCYWRIFLWSGDILRVRTLLGRETRYRISDVRMVAGNEEIGEYRITFSDGSKLRLPTHLHGVEELMANVPEHARIVD